MVSEHHVYSCYGEGGVSINYFEQRPLSVAQVGLGLWSVQLQTLQYSCICITQHEYATTGSIRLPILRNNELQRSNHCSFVHAVRKTALNITGFPMYLMSLEDAEHPFNGVFQCSLKEKGAKLSRTNTLPKMGQAQ